MSTAYAEIFQGAEMFVEEAKILALLLIAWQIGRLARAMRAIYVELTVDRYERCRRKPEGSLEL